MKTRKADITIDGQGFYTIAANSVRGIAFMRQVEGSSDGVAYCDDTRMAVDIADGAVHAGLRVEVNDKVYLPERGER